MRTQSLKYWLFAIGLCTSLYCCGQTKDSVKFYIYAKGFSDPETVFKQSMLESGWLKCERCALDHNNLFGFSFDGVKYLEFDHWMESIDYLYEWEQKYCGTCENYKECVYLKWNAYDMDAYMEVLDLIYTEW